MKTNTVISKNKQTKGFTLIEMIGVLAVIAILAALLIPKVFQAITEARINTVPVGAATCKTAVVDHYAKFGGLNLNATGTPIDVSGGAYVNYDETVLMAAGFLDKAFAPRVGTGADIVLDAVGAVAPAATVDPTEGTSYCLAGLVNPGTNEVAGSHVVYAVINEVPVADAQAISFRIDGLGMSSPEATPATADTRGRVKYEETAAGSGIATVYIYLTHR